MSGDYVIPRGVLPKLIADTIAAHLEQIASRSYGTERFAPRGPSLIYSDLHYTGDAIVAAMPGEEGCWVPMWVIDGLDDPVRPHIMGPVVDDDLRAIFAWTIDGDADGGYGEYRPLQWLAVGRTPGQPLRVQVHAPSMSHLVEHPSAPVGCGDVPVSGPAAWPALE